MTKQRRRVAAAVDKVGMASDLVTHAIRALEEVERLRTAIELRDHWLQLKTQLVEKHRSQFLEAKADLARVRAKLNKTE